jgi:hypothetical protein
MNSGNVLNPTIVYNATSHLILVDAFAGGGMGSQAIDPFTFNQIYITDTILPSSTVDIVLSFGNSNPASGGGGGATSGNYTVTSSVGGGSGSVSPSGSSHADPGADFTVTATPASGWNINHIEVDGVDVGNPSAYTFSGVSSNHTLVAYFALNSSPPGTASIYMLPPIGHGSVTPPAGLIPNPGLPSPDNLTISATPLGNDSFITWQVGWEVGGVWSYGNYSVASFMFPYLNTLNMTFQAFFTGKMSTYIPPTQESGISNLEGGGNWVFQGHTIYRFWVNSTIIAGSNETGWQITQGIHFEDASSSQFSALWDAVTNQTVYDTGDEGVTFSLLNHVATNTTANSMFGVIFEPNISDTFNVTLYTYGGYSATPTWVAQYPNYFNIYNLGGYVRYRFADPYSFHPVGSDALSLTTTTIGSYAYADMTYRYLQHIHFLFSLDTGNVTAPGIYLVSPSSSHAYGGCVEYGMQVLVNGTWIKEWSVRLDVADGDVDTHSTAPNTSWVKIRVRWYHLEELVKTDYLVTYDWGVDAQQDIIPTQQPIMKFWVDLWFSNANAAETVAGRVNAYWAGMDSSGLWISDYYYAKYGNVTDSMFNAPLTNLSGNTFSAKDLTLMRVYENMTMTSYSDVWRTYGYNVFTVEKATETMSGIETPSSEFQPTEDPSVPMGSLLGGLSSIMQGVAAAISQAINYGALQLSGYFWAATGWFFGLMGQPNYVKITLTWISQLGTAVWTGASWMFALINGAFWIMNWVYQTVFVGAAYWWNTWANMINEILQIFTGAYVQSTNLWTFLDIPIWVTLFLIVAPFMILDTYSRKSTGVMIKDAREAAAFIDDHVIGLIMRVISFFRDLIFDMIESIPVVE